jgi:aromatic-L-amino-acid/L-tryptophan decarboxylase
MHKLLPDAARELGRQMEDVLEDMRHDILPGLTHWQSPNFFAYFPMNAISAGFGGGDAVGRPECGVVHLGRVTGRRRARGRRGGLAGPSQPSPVLRWRQHVRGRGVHDRTVAVMGHEAIGKLVVHASD